MANQTRKTVRTSGSARKTTTRTSTRQKSTVDAPAVAADTPAVTSPVNPEETPAVMATEITENIATQPPQPAIEATVEPVVEPAVEATSEPAVEVTPEPAVEPVTAPAIDPAVAQAVQAVIEKYSKWSFGVGFIPLPTVDLVALTSIQLKMIAEIAKVYGQSFSDNKLRSVVGALLGAALPRTLTAGGVSSTVKAIPIYGTLVGMATMPMVSAAVTYAIGVTFSHHFRCGGTLLSLNLGTATTRFEAALAQRKAAK